ncbi:acyl-CoA dehydrogenase, partial [Tsukamurella tyrosinosolvens]
LTGLDRSLLSRIFDVQIRDFSAYAVGLYGKPVATPAQQQWALDAVRRPVADPATFDRVWEQVAAYDGAYEMRP